MLGKVDILTVTLLFAHINNKQMPDYFDIPAPGVAKEYDYIIGKLFELYTLLRKNFEKPKLFFSSFFNERVVR